MRQSFFLIGSFSIYFYGIFIALGVFLGYLLAKRRLPKFGLNEKELDFTLILLLPAAVIGARIYHVLSWLSYYKMFPKEILSIRQGGLGIFGSLIAGFLFLLLLSKIKKINLLSLLDLISPSILLTQAVGRLGNFFNQEAFGPPTNLPWKFYVPPDNRPINFLSQSYFHPTFLYESILCFLALIILLYLERKLKPRKGFSLGFYLTAYGIIRFFTEFLRFDTWSIHGIKVAQLISFVFIAIGGCLIRNGIKGKKLIK